MSFPLAGNIAFCSDEGTCERARFKSALKLLEVGSFAEARLSFVRLVLSDLRCEVIPAFSVPIQ